MSFDSGRRRVAPHNFGARRNLSGVCERWYPVIREHHRFLRFRLSRKTRDQYRSRVWKRLRVSDFSLVSIDERHQHVHLPVGALVEDRVGVG